MGAAFVVLKNPAESEQWYRKALDLWIELQEQHALRAKEIDKPKEVAENLSPVHSGNLQKRLP